MNRSYDLVDIVKRRAREANGGITVQDVTATKPLNSIISVETAYGEKAISKLLVSIQASLADDAVKEMRILKLLHMYPC